VWQEKKVNMKKNILLLILLFIVAEIFYLPIMNIGLSPYDEGLILVGAERVLKGQIPYKDFSSAYPPGQYYTIAALFDMFGTSVTTERIYDISVRAILSLFIFLIIRLLSSNKLAFVGWTMSLVWMGHSSYPGYPVYPSILFIYISVYCLLRHIKQNSIYYVALSAVTIVFAIFFRHDLGGYAAIAMVIFLFFIRTTGVHKSWTPFIAFIVIGIISALPVITYFFLNSALEFIINDMILMPINVLTEYAQLPYPSLSRYTLSFYLFPLVLLISVIISLVLIKRKTNHMLAYGGLLISFIGLLFLFQVSVRSDIGHLLPAALTGIVSASILLCSLTEALSLNILQRRAFYMLFIIVFSVTFYRPISTIGMILKRTKGYIVSTVNADMDRVRYLNIDSDLKKTVTYIKNNTLANEYIYVGVKNHDQFRFNDPVIYFLAERNCATKYHELDAGVTTTIKTQSEMINELKNKDTPLVVLAVRDRYEPNLSKIDTNVNLLDNYIGNNYELKKTYGIYEILMKKYQG
jgi:hypothetical protein